MPAAAIPAISVGLGALGLLQANEHARKQGNLQNQALAQQQAAINSAEAGNKPVVEALAEMLAMARKYDPGRETQIAVDRASEVTENTLAKALGGLNARYRAAGGVPGLSSEFNVKAQGLTNRVTDPLREFVANQKVNEFAKKLAAFQAVNGGNPGNLAANYFNAAAQNAALSQAYAPNYGPGLNLLSNALQQLFNKPGSEASGSMRQAVQNISQTPWRWKLGDDSYMNYGQGYAGNH